MNIKIGNLELSGWQKHPDGFVQYKIEDERYYGRIVILLSTNSYRVYFYDQLAFCNSMFNHYECFGLKIEAIKKIVDSFLIKIDNLLVYS